MNKKPDSSVYTDISGHGIKRTELNDEQVH